MNEKHKEKVFGRYFGRNELYFRPVFPDDTEVVVVIPVLDDEDIFRTVDSLKSCTREEGGVAVVVIVNHGEQVPDAVKEANCRLAEELREYVAGGQRGGLFFQVVEAFDLPARTAGVGLARKLAMDAAAWWFYEHDKADGVILSLDADTWVEMNYTDAVRRYFRENPVAGVSIAYRHRLEECEGAVREAMAKYELYLRYYQGALAYSGHPHAYPCIGSAFAVRARDYVAEGGMNKRQAGEDFYFLQKLISTGRYAFLRTTTVYPSARFSARTPFGTGQSLRQIVAQGGSYPVYHWEAFRDLKCFFDGVGCLYKVENSDVESFLTKQSPGVRDYWQHMDGCAMLAEVNANCASVGQFRKRFFDGFNAFRVLKYLNHMHDLFYPKIEITEAVDRWLAEMGMAVPGSAEEKLVFLRNFQYFCPEE